MAGLAALLSFGSDRKSTDTLTALSRALVPRGSEEARGICGSAKLLIRAAMPIVHRLDTTTLIVDGIVELSTLAHRYADRGPLGLVSGPDPYTLIMADPDGLVLARNGDGPPLYYARCRGAVLVASEPAALLAAGVPARPDPETVARFLAVGSCDEGAATFFDGIRRVLPNQVVEISAGHTDGWLVRAHPPVRHRGHPVTGRMALLGAVGEGRLGVLLGPGLPGAAVLGAALSERAEPRGLPVYSVNFPGLPADSSAYASALLGPLPDNHVRHKALPFFADEIDVDGFLTDVGEPMPDLSSYLAWAVARATGGEVDALLGAGGWSGPVGHLPRLADRVASRYGVALRFPYRDLETTDEALRAELRGLAERTLPPVSLRAAATAPAAATLEPPLREIMLRLRAETISALLYPRHGGTDHEGLAVMQHLPTAGEAEVARLWRRYLLERWLTTVLAPYERTPDVPASRPAPGPVVITAAGQDWTTHALVTEPITAGDRFADKFAWYVAEFAHGADKGSRQALRRPWHLLVAAKPVAVAQGLSRAIWEIEPGSYARALVRLAGPAVGLADPWSMQVALDHGGRSRLGLAVLCARLGRRVWSERIAGPLVRSVCPPREQACPPAHLAVVPPPGDADRVAEQIVAALRKTLPDDVYAMLAGCAVVGAGDGGMRLLGWSQPGEPPAGLLERLCERNPFGQGDERTPLVLALSAQRRVAQSTGRKGAKASARRR
ncbi:hypothetical protein Cme02nite_17690 [Catellatospora methionotrophica]|uniref:Asparagine synthase (Glutamine-hydrolysing) n=1 Tax=Catellatospora methionotrophica TaxID=121620 RepID=A0A8J3L2M1_9ACTN|nr:hypothetical protein [Catellatospora methionotrophica]GIG13437.1 hypothetical protein Cme02nite_17690 [Catellatospora methionotrophica]